MAILITVLALGMSVVFFAVSFEFPRLAADPGGSALFPRVVATMTAIACVLYLVQSFMTSKSGLGDWLRQVPRGWATVGARKVEIASFGLVLLLPITINSLGFVPAGFGFVMLLMLISGLGILRALIAALLVTAAVYVGYALILGAILPRGYLLT